MFMFGMSGGAQSSIIGASGDSELYTPYLESIGAAMTDAAGQSIRDAVFGAMAWCPITSLDYADEAYEWNMGQYASTSTRASDTFTSALSKDMATAFQCCHHQHRGCVWDDHFHRNNNSDRLCDGDIHHVSNCAGIHRLTQQRRAVGYLRCGHQQGNHQQHWRIRNGQQAADRACRRSMT